MTASRSGREREDDYPGVFPNPVQGTDRDVVSFFARPGLRITGRMSSLMRAEREETADGGGRWSVTSALTHCHQKTRCALSSAVIALSIALLVLTGRGGDQSGLKRSVYTQVDFTGAPRIADVTSDI